MNDEYLSPDERAILRRTKKRLEEEPTVNGEKYFFKGALHIDPAAGRVFVAQPIPRPRIVKGKPVLDTDIFIISHNDSFFLRSEALEKRDLFPTSIPALSMPYRWSACKNVRDDGDHVDPFSGYRQEDVFSLHRDLVSMFDHFVSFDTSSQTGNDGHTSSLLSVWVMMTYLYPIFNEIPFINLIGYRASGKSKVLSILEKLCFNAEATSNTSVAALFRLVEQNMSTVLIDEAEKLTGTEKEPELRLLLNTCYKKGGVVTRFNIETNKIEHFYTYAPVAIAAINQLEPTLASRSIPIVMNRTTGPQGNRRVTETSYPWQETRDRLYRFLFAEYKEIDTIYRSSDTWGNLRCRDLEKWQGLLTIARLVDERGGDHVFDRLLTMAQEELQEEASLTDIEEGLVEALEEMVIADNYYLVRDIKGKVIERIVESGNSELAEEVTGRAIGAMLRKFGITQKEHCREGWAYRINAAMVKQIVSRYTPQ